MDIDTLEIMESCFRVVPSIDDFASIQKFYCNKIDWCIKNLVYILVPISKECQAVCRIEFTENTNKNFCRFDASVVNILGVISNSDGLPCCKLKVTQPSSVKSKDIVFIDSAHANIKTVKVTAVFDNVMRAGLWSHKKSKLLELIQSILEVFVITEHCIVYLNNLKPIKSSGIYCLIVRTNKLPGGVGKISPRTNFELISVVSKIEFEFTQNKSTPTPNAGLEKPYNELLDFVKQRLEYATSGFNHGISPCSKVLVTGPPGCGKTSLVKRVCEECQAPLILVMGGTSADSLPGEAETKLREAFSRAAAIPKGILLLDQLDSLCPKRSDVTASHILRLSTQLLTLLEDPKGPALIIATTSRPYAIEPAARRPGRLDREIFIGPPTQEERKSMLKALLIPQNPPNIEALCEDGAYMTPGYVAADLALLAKETALKVWRRGSGLDIWRSELKAAVTLMRPAALRGGLGVVTTELTTLDQLGGLDTIKLRLQAAIEWPLLYPQAFSRLGLSRPKGVLLYGPPGCAKTSLVRAMASASGTTFLAISAAELYSPLVGDTERSLVDLFQRARATAPTILFIDEIDSLVGGRGADGEQNSGVQERVLSTLLVELDGTTVPSTGGGVTVVAATNRPDNLDAALMRPGRFDRIIFVPEPDKLTRLTILNKICANMPLASNIDIEDIATKTELYSGADLQNLCREAALGALVEAGMKVNVITSYNFTSALQQSRPSLTSSQLDWYHKFNMQVSK